MRRLNDDFERSSKMPKHVIHDGVKWLMVPAKAMVAAASEWPENQNNVTRTMHILCLSSIIFVVMGHFYCFIDKDSELVSNAYAIIYFIICFESIIRRIIIYFHRENLSKIIKKVYFEFWPSKSVGTELDTELTKQSKYVFFYCATYTTTSFLCAIQFLVTSLLDRSLPLKTRYPFRWQDSPSYELLYVWQTFLCFEIVFAVCAVDLFLLSLLCNCIAQFKLLRVYLRSNFEKIMLEKKHGYKTEAREVLRSVIIRHNELLRTCQEIDKTFSNFILIQCLVNIATVCLSSFIMTTVPGLIRIAFLYLVGHLSELFIFCYMGQDLILESTELSTAAFDCGWHLSSEDIDLQKTLILIMVRAQKPIQVTTGGFGFLSLASFVNLLKFSFSLYTLLKSLLGEQNDA